MTNRKHQSQRGSLVNSTKYLRKEFISYTPLSFSFREQKQKEYILGQRYSNTKTRQRYYKRICPWSFFLKWPAQELSYSLYYLIYTNCNENF